MRENIKISDLDVIKNLSAILINNGLSPVEIDHVFAGLFDIIFESSFNRTLHLLQASDPENAGKVLQLIDVAEKPDSSPAARVDSFFDNAARYLTREKISAVIREETERTLLDYLDSIKNKKIL